MGIDSKRIAGDIIAKGLPNEAIQYLKARHPWHIYLTAEDIMHTNPDYRTVAHNMPQDLPRCLCEVPSFFLCKENGYAKFPRVEHAFFKRFDGHSFFFCVWDPLRVGGSQPAQPGARGEGSRMVKIIAPAVPTDAGSGMGLAQAAMQSGCKSGWLAALGTGRQAEERGEGALGSAQAG